MVSVSGIRSMLGDADPGPVKVGSPKSRNAPPLNRCGVAAK
jgi:hypothetical protein